MTKNQKHRNAEKRAWRNYRNYRVRTEQAFDLLDQADQSFELYLAARKEMENA